MFKLVFICNKKVIKNHKGEDISAKPKWVRQTLLGSGRRYSLEMITSDIPLHKKIETS